MSIGLQTSIANRPHRITLQNPSGEPEPDPDGEGGYTQPYAALNPPAVNARIAPATAADLERVAAGTVVATASHIVTMPYHPQVTTETRITFNGRTFYVQGVTNPEERNVETIALCQEVVR